MLTFHNNNNYYCYFPDYIILGDTSDYVIEARGISSNDIDHHLALSHWDLEEVHKNKINGEGIAVAVLDSGINIHHNDFKKNKHLLLKFGKNFINGKEEDYWYTNREEHGTMVTGIVAQYAPKAEIHVYCVSEENKFKKDAIIEALKYIKAQNKCQVIVMSFGHLKDEEYENRKSLIDDLAGKGVICVAAIGNIGLNAEKLAFPARLNNVIAVGGLTEFGRPLPLNNPGQIDMYAPGETVYAPGVTSNSKYQKGRGTSFAAPAIGGIVALLIQLAQRPGVQIKLSMELIKKIFKKMTYPLNPSSECLLGREERFLSPKDFFNEYGTESEFKKLISDIIPNPN